MFYVKRQTLFFSIFSVIEIKLFLILVFISIRRNQPFVETKIRLVSRRCRLCSLINCPEVWKWPRVKQALA